MRAAVYARVSGTDDPRDASLDTQVEATQKKFRELGYVVEAEDVYVEKYTGTNLHDRPEMSRMLGSLTPTCGAIAMGAGSGHVS
jgi:DNA invertase Pin-like site-specific DNA recombinase